MIQKIEHTAIMVRDMEESLSFYCDILGFTLRLRGRSGDRELAFLYQEGHTHTEVELICVDNPDPAYKEHSIVNHLAFTVGKIEETIAYLKEKDVEFMTEDIKPTLEGGRMIMFWGPNRELLQLVERLKQ